MARKKARDLDQLLRLHGWIVDERRRELGVLLDREARLIEAMEALEREIAAEKAVAAADPTGAGRGFGSYADNRKTVREALDHQKALLAQEIDAQRERLADAYRQLKVYEEVQKARAEAEAKERDQKEQEMLDEIALNQFRRR